jgi:PTS system galactitol-specific IIA component
MDRRRKTSDNSMLNSELVKVGLEAADREAAICFLAALLERGGYVNKSYQAAVLERERTFLTGLPTGEINVAIPHADAVHVLQSAIAVGVLAKQSSFIR